MSDEELLACYGELFHNNARIIPEDARVRKLVKELNHEIQAGNIIRNGMSNTIYVGTIWAELCIVLADRYYKLKMGETE